MTLARSDRSKTVQYDINIKFVSNRVYRSIEVYLQSDYPDISFSISYDSEFLPKRQVMSIKIHSQEEMLEI